MVLFFILKQIKFTHPKSYNVYLHDYMAQKTDMIFLTSDDLEEGI